ncbi:hypothetical protein DFH07DRAFT_773416 [Mycena maculata]|uniref:Uncharacterized protein n=1 Tax=Mycena maculata TaxID=230809 RepID=A0AAD7J3Y0_9AGAR|nr:hypothetical protein DFH07DRAFT_773416 [Mycena maculata]
MDFLLETSQLLEASQSGSESGMDLDAVGSSQPFQDGEEDLGPLDHKKRNISPQGSPSSLAPSDANSSYSRQARLVRRAPPVKPGSLPLLPSMQGPTRPRSQLVRHCTSGPSPSTLRALEIEWKREQAREKAWHIVKKIKALATATA